MSGPTRTVVVTGATGGIGLHTALGLARQGLRVVITGRDAGRGARALDRIERETGGEAYLVLGDLSRRAGAEELGRALRARFDRIDVLINNAGNLSTRLEHNPDGVELDFAVNVLAPYVLTRTLLPALEAARPARVINVTGGMPFGGLDVDNLEAQKGFAGLMTYSHSKRAMEAMSLALASELQPRGVFVHVVFPGGASTAMTQAMEPSTVPWWMRPLWPVFTRLMADDGGRGAAKASRSSVWAASAPELVQSIGGYFDTESRPARLQASVRQASHQRQVMAHVTRLAGS